MADSNTVALNNGKNMPLLGLGTWKSQPGQVSAAVQHAIAKGYRHIDAAAVYGNEQEVGEGIKKGLEDAKIKREDLWVTSKLWNTRHHPDDVENACKKTLSDLGLAYLDLYLIHWPHAFKSGDNPFPKNEDGSVQFETGVPPLDTWLAMEKLLEKGLVKSIGLSNFNSEQIQEVLDKGKVKPVTNQVESHPYLNQSKLKAFCDKKDIFLTAYSPLGSPDRPWATPDEPKLLEDSKLTELAKKYEKSPAQIVLRWQVQRKVITIPKSVTPSRIEENAAIFDFQLTEEEMTTVAGFDLGEKKGRLIVPMLNGKHRDAAHPHYPFNIEF